jgi:hypothetical protein
MTGMLRTKLLPSAALLFATALVLGACGGDDDDSAADAPDTTTTTAAATTAPTTTADTAFVVAVGETDLGAVLVDGDGMTLYIFDRTPTA